jgi:hypothetical protein
MNNYENDLKINKHDLDNEWINQPFLQMKYVKLAAEAETKMRKKKEHLEITKANLYLKIRNEKEIRKEKVTEAVLDAAIKTSPEYTTVFEEYLEALEIYKILTGAVEAFQQRKSSLENMVKLYLNNYFSHPKQEQEKEFEKVQKDNLSKKLVKNKRRKI